MSNNFRCKDVRNKNDQNISCGMADYSNVNLTQLRIVIVEVNAYDTSVKVIDDFHRSGYCNGRFCENTADFHKFEYCDKLIAGNNI